MDSSHQASPTSDDPQRPSQIKPARRFIFGGVFMLVLAAAVVGVYAWQQKKVDDLNKQVVSLSAQKAASGKSSNTTASASNVRYTHDIGAGYPLSLTHERVIVNLYLPADINLLPYSNDIRSQASYAGLYSESLNDLIGRWFFVSQGTTTKPSQSGEPSNEIFMSAMDHWESIDDSAPVNYPQLYGSLVGTQMTSAQKRAFVAQLKSQTAACAADSTQGFSTDDKVFNVCYQIGHPQAEGANYILFFKGYGELKGIPTYLGGFASLPNATYQSTLATYVQAFKKIAATVEANPYNP